MQIHLIELSSPTPLFRRFGNHKFQLCMMILSELRSTYWGADAVYKLFEHALARVQKPDSPKKKKRARARPRGQIQILRSYSRRLPQWSFLRPNTILAQAIFKAILIRTGLCGMRTTHSQSCQMKSASSLPAWGGNRTMDLQTFWTGSTRY